MDVPRKDAARRRWTRRLLFVGLLAVVVPAITIGLSRMKPAAPLVENVWPDEVKRGPMVRRVRGMGTLVAEDILWIPATTDGRVERILVRPGTAVKPETVIVVLKNPELDLSALDTEYQVKAAEARYIDLKVQLQGQALTDRAETARMESEYTRARLIADRDEALYKEGLLIELTYKLNRTTADQLAKRVGIEQERLAMKHESVDAQLAVQRTEIDKLKALHRLKLDQVEALHVRAGASGVLQEMPMTEGQRVAAGTILAKVAQPSRLKAELKVAETQVKDVALGQKVEVDTRNGIIPGRVSRIDPAARDGTVVVDVRLEGVLPAGARPDLSVDGNIEIERLADVVYVGRPAFGQPNSTVTMFKLDPVTKEATRVQVRFGRVDVSIIEILEGLRPGDKVILSDMSAWDAYERVRTN